MNDEHTSTSIRQGAQGDGVHPAAAAGHQLRPFDVPRHRGQDADLIMLGLSLHEPKVLILCERVDPPQRSKGAKQKRE